MRLSAYPVPTHPIGNVFLTAGDTILLKSTGSKESIGGTDLFDSRILAAGNATKLGPPRATTCARTCRVRDDVYGGLNARRRARACMYGARDTALCTDPRTTGHKTSGRRDACRETRLGYGNGCGRGLGMCVLRWA